MSLKELNPVWNLTDFEQPLVLASSSPRRADILRSVGCPFEVVSPEINEGSYGIWDGGELLRHRAVQKAESVARRYPDRAVISADTIVRIGESVFGKPENNEDAIRILKALSGKTHEVWSVLCLLVAGNKHPRTRTSCTMVNFHILKDEEIAAYVETGEPMDKAGAYGIQGVGGLWVRSITGCYFNIMGLPLSQLWSLIKTS